MAKKESASKAKKFNLIQLVGEEEIVKRKGIVVSEAFVKSYNERFKSSGLYYK